MSEQERTENELWHGCSSLTLAEVKPSPVKKVDSKKDKVSAGLRLGMALSMDRRNKVTNLNEFGMTDPFVEENTEHGILEVVKGFDFYLDIYNVEKCLKEEAMTFFLELSKIIASR